MSSYRINDPRQGLIGPIKLETVRDLVSTGVIQDDVLISKDDGQWQPVTEFAEVFGRPEPAGHRKASYIGELSKTSFFKIFSRLYFSQADGMLIVKSPPRQKEIYLEKGKPVFITSNLDAERLSALLVRQGLLSEAELKQAIAVMHEDQNHLNLTLVRLGLMDAAAVEHAIITQQIERLVDLCHWRVGQYLFFEGARYLGEKLDLKLIPNQLILKAAYSADASFLRESLLLYDNAVVRFDNSEYQNDLPPLTAIGQQVVTQIDGTHKLAEILQQFNEQPANHEALALIYLLWEIDAISFLK
ncbi:MAG: DUF4388 domain-containing protein [Deltaproteobacteria bacterium]|nr:DUF4388 domain-containing protein [Deltaproteobacteria bacterium]